MNTEKNTARVIPRSITTHTATLVLFSLLMFSPGTYTYAQSVPALPSPGAQVGDSRIGQQAHDFKAVDILTNQPISIKSLKGDVVLINFWATWCKPCKVELPWLNTMQQRYASKGLRIITVSVDDKAKQAKRALSKLNPQFISIHDINHHIAEAYKPSAMPNSFIIGRDGRIRYVHLGFQKKDMEHIEAEINKALLHK